MKSFQKYIPMIILLIAVIAVAGCTSTQSTDNGETLIIGVLLHLSGDLVSSGETSNLAIAMAKEDINQFLSEKYPGVELEVVIRDTETDPRVTLQHLREFDEQGIQLVVGPQISSVTKTAKGYADQHDMILLSQSSTSPELSIKGDNVFRLVPDDVGQIKAIIKMLEKDDIDIVIPFRRGDVFGNNFYQIAKREFEENGGLVGNGVVYSTVNADFSEELDTYGVDHVAVGLVSFDEVVDIFKEASKHQALASVQWYGSDATALSSALVANTVAADFAVKTNFKNPQFGADDTIKGGEIVQDIERQLGRTSDDYAILAYDAVWILTKTYFAANRSHDINVLQDTLFQVANTHQGATGVTTLNEAGDRESGNFKIWVVNETDSGYTWDFCCTVQV